jgi:hypothetical protein
MFGQEKSVAGFHAKGLTVHSHDWSACDAVNKLLAGMGESIEIVAWPKPDQEGLHTPRGAR